jgi:hypothetical protein
MPDSVTDEQLAAYLQEQLPLAELAAVEKSLRENEPLRRRAAALAFRRDLPYHSVGASGPLIVQVANLFSRSICTST